MRISMGVQLTFEPILQLSVNVEDHSFILDISLKQCAILKLIAYS